MESVADPFCTGVGLWMPCKSFDLWFPKGTRFLGDYDIATTHFEAMDDSLLI